MKSDCSKCFWGYYNNCQKVRCSGGCPSCDNLDSETLECKCTLIIEDDECPNFREYEE